MSARKAFVLGAIVGAGALAAVGAVSAGSSSSSAPATVHLAVGPQGRAETVPTGLIDDVASLDYLLTGLLKAEQKKGGITPEQRHKRIHAIEVEKYNMVVKYFSELELYGVSARTWINSLDCVDSSLSSADVFGSLEIGQQITLIKNAEACKKQLEKKLTAAAKTPPPPPPNPNPLTEVDEFDTWAHNTDIGKSNICINVRTNPPQTSFSVMLDGPDGYISDLPKTPLDKDGTIRITSEITKAGEYTKTLYTYNAEGVQTRSMVVKFTVLPPPPDGPANGPTPTFGKSCPKPTQ